MLVSNKHFTPVIGLDIHIVLLFGFPIPLPHPYIGLVIDPMDYIPMLGATTKINHVPRGKSDTSGLFIILFHIPMGGPFLLAPLIGHDSVNFFGSKRVKVEGNLMSPSGHMLMTCNDIGIPLSLQPGKKLKPLPSMYLPTSFSIPLSLGKPVNVGGPYVPDWAGALMNLVASFGFGALMKGAKGAVKKFNHALQDRIGSNKLSSVLCHLGLEPVDMVQGIVVSEGIDFELPGPIPLVWERCWNSDSPHNGPLGHGAHLCYDMRVLEFPEEDATAVLLGDGRSALFEPLPYAGNSDYNRHEKMTLTRTDLDEYHLLDHRQRLHYHFRNLHTPGTQHQQYRLYAIRDDAGFMISFHYGSRGQLLHVIDSAGRRLHIDNDDQGRITAVTVRHRGQEQVMVRYAYNEEGDLAGITDALEQTTVLQYRRHLLVSKTDRNGQSFYWEYDNKGRCVHSRGDGGVMEGWIEYHPREGYNLVTNSLGQTTTYYYTPDFVVTQIKNPEGHSRFFEYTEHFEIYREIDEEGNFTGYTYDDRGNRTSLVQADGSAYTFAYDAEGRLISSTDPQGNGATYIYYKKEKHKGLLHTVTEADGSISIFRYNEQNLPVRIEHEDNRETRLEYDADLNISAITLPGGGRTAWEYDVWGQCVAFRDPQQQEQLFRYDALGRVVQVTLPDGNQVKLQYNAYDEVITMSDRHHSVRFDYTALGSLKMREENGARVHFIYNTEEQLTGVVNEHGDTLRLVRNAQGDIIRETGFDGLTYQYERDATGKVIKVHRPGGRWTEYEYDFNGNLTRLEHNDGSWETYSYDRSGRLIEAVNEHSTVKLQRNRMGQIIQEWQNGYTVTSVYDHHSRRKRVQSSLGADILLQRDGAGEVTAMQAQAPGLNSPWLAEIQRNLLGLEIERTLPGGVKSSWTYDKIGLPESHTVNSGTRTARRRLYRWDAGKRLKEIINSVNGGAVQFSYNDIGSLAWAKYENNQFDYRLPDKAGNLYNSQSKDRKYGPGGQLLETKDARFQYDEEGNLVKKIVTAAPAGALVWEYEWYANGLLKKVTRPDRKTVEFRYDALGRRIEKLYNGQLTRFVWDGDVPLHEWRYPEKERPKAVIDEDGNLQQSHPEPVPPESLTTWIFDEDTFAPAARISNGRQYAIIVDHAGTPCEAYDETGQKIWECELDIYGRVRKLAGQRDLVPFRYQGQYEDVETGLYYNRFRYYSPEEGLYLSQDPLGLAGGWRFYAYVDDPNIYVDAWGLKRGGSYSSVRSYATKHGWGGEVNHMPAFNAYENLPDTLKQSMTPGKGPTIWMEKPDHLLTASHGHRGAAGALYRRRQEAFIRKGRWDKAVEMDIRDVRKIAAAAGDPTRYDDAIMEMLEYSKKKKLITEAQFKRLARMCKKK